MEKIGKSAWQEGRHFGAGCAPPYFFFVEIGQKGKKNAPNRANWLQKLKFFSTSEGLNKGNLGEDSWDQRA